MMKRLSKKDSMEDPGLVVSWMGGNRLIGVLGLAIAIVVIFSAYALDKVHEAVRREITVDLEHSLHNTREFMALWLAARTDDHQSIFNHFQTLQLVQEVLSLPPAQEILTKSPALIKLREMILKDIAVHEDERFYIVSPEGSIFVSERDEPLGTRHILADHGDSLKKILNGDTKIVWPFRAEGAPGQSQPLMFLGTPIRDVKDKVVAALLVQLDPAADFSGAVQTSRYADTEDIYMFNAAGELLSNVAFSDQLHNLGLLKPGEGEILNLRLCDPGGNLLEGFRPVVAKEQLPLTRMAREAIAGNSGIDVEGYHDYRGVPVVGAWQWDPEQNVGMAVEIDVAEAYAPYYTLRRIVILALAGISTVFTVLAIGLVMRQRRVVTANRQLKQEMREREKAGEALMKSEAYISAVIDAAKDAIIVINPDGIIQTANTATEEIFGYPAEFLIGKNVSLLMPEPHRSSHDGYLANYLQTGIKKAIGAWCEVRGRRKDGSEFPLEINIGEIRVGKSRMFSGMLRDMSEKKAQMEQIRQLSLAMEQSATITIITDRDGLIEYVNPEFEQATGYRRDEVIGKKTNILKSGKTPPELYRELWATILRGAVFRDVLINRRKNGELYYEEKSIAPLLNEQGVISHFVSTGMDVTQRQKDQERLDFLAYHDLLTGLPNRALLEDRLRQAIVRAQRYKHSVVLMFLDLDNFKVINDSLGHEAGDKLLVETAQRLRHCMRAADTVARLGGDEFTILMDGVKDNDQVALRAENVLNSLAPPFLIAGQELFVSASIGIAIFPDDATVSGDLLRSADTAMYHAKESGRGNYQFYSAEMTAKITRRLTLDRKLRHALEHEEFRVFYQPKVDFRSGQVIGAEALLRWQPPGEGVISPGEFIPRLEESGLILPVGEWLIAAVGGHWQTLRAIIPLPEFRLALNFSPKQFQQNGLAERVMTLLDAGHFPPENLIVEVTESAVMHNIKTSIETLQTLRNHGVKIAMDDFGTGYSSLSYLKRLPLDELKIDRSFVTGLPDDEDDVQLVTAILSMAHSMKLHVVAEGVETEEQRQLLKSLQCDTMQGYLFSPPLPFEAFVSLLKESGRLGSMQHD